MPRRLPLRATIKSVEFIAIMNEIKSKNIEEISNELKKLYPGRQNQVIRERTKADYIPFLRNWQRETREIIEQYQMIINSGNFDNIGYFLNSLTIFSNKLQREQVSRNPTAPLPSRAAALPSNLEVRDIGFRNVIITYEPALESLNHYETTAVDIRSDAGAYFGSKLHELEKLLYDRQSYLNSHRFSSSRINASSSFVALAAPSMEGKTQSAFVFEMVKPLYFALSTTTVTTKNRNLEDDVTSMRQSIYQNFKGVTDALHIYAERDLAQIVTLDKTTGSDCLQTELREMHSEVLGFLVALVNDARRPEVKNQSWMRYHSTRPDFTFRPVRIADISKRRDFFKGFVLFLDEFVGEPWAIYVRNLVRAVGLTCLVANTNTKIANLVGRESTSGSSEAFIWSIVIISLSPASLNFLDHNYQLLSSIQTINQNSADPGVELFLQNFKDEQVKYLRAGVSSYMAEAIRDFANQGHRNINLRWFLDNVLRSVAQKLKDRKFRNPMDLVAQCAKVGLLLPESYNKSVNVGSNSWFSQGVSFLQNHLYHLTNPAQPENWIFLTCPPRKSSEFLQYVDFNSTWDWTRERTFFEPNEKSTILACLFLPLGNTVTDFLERAKIEHNDSPFGVYNAENRRALQLPGNPLEVSAAVSIVDSSQHSFAIPIYGQFEEIFSLGGQKGSDFMRNLVLNMINEYNYKRTERIVDLNYDKCTYNLRHYFNHVKVPFLYSLDREDAFLDELNNISRFIYLRQYVRTSNTAQIDGKFDFKYNDQERTAIVECKNRGKTIGSGLLKTVIENALNTENSNILFVFCIEMVDKARKSNFTGVCEKDEVNVYRIKRTGWTSYEIAPFFETSRSPRLICILLESRVINRSIII